MKLKPYETIEERIMNEDGCAICGAPPVGDLLVCSSGCSDLLDARQARMNSELYDFRSDENNDY